MSAGLFFQLLACAVTLAIYMLSAETSQVSSMDFCNAVLGTTLTLSSTYLYCYFSENVTYNLASIGQSFYQSDWYRLPPEQQKLAILSIQRAQREFRMTGLGLVDCSLRIFSSVRCFLVISSRLLLDYRKWAYICSCFSDYTSHLVVLLIHARIQINWTQRRNHYFRMEIYDLFRLFEYWKSCKTIE